ncbi:hypothetical protein MKD33_02525, partial [Chromobacterium piscinae]
AVIRAA